MVTNQRGVSGGPDWGRSVGATWTVDEVARELRCDIADVMRLARHEQVIELETSDGSRLFPVWQFDGGAPLRGLVDLLAELPEAAVDRWTLAAWCRLPQELLGGRSVADSLSSGAPLEDVLRVCRRAALRWST